MFLMGVAAEDPAAGNLQTLKPQAFAWGVVVVAGAVMLLEILGTPQLLGPSEEPLTFSDFLFWLVVVGATEITPIALGFEAVVTMTFPVHIAMAIVFRNQPWVAMAISGLGAFDPREFRREIPLWWAVFNRAQTMLCVGAAAAVFAFFQSDPYRVVPVVAAATLHLAVNMGLVAGLVSLDLRVPFRHALAELPPKPMTGFAMSYVLFTALGVVTAIAFDRWGPPAIAAILIPILFGRLSILGAKKQEELSEHIRQQQEALLRASEQVFQERERERTRIAETIHDTSLQQLAAASYASQNAEIFLGSGDVEGARRTVNSARQATQNAISSLREAIADLRRAAVEEGGLVETIKKFADELVVVWDAEVKIEGEIENEPPTPVSLAAVQIVQEAIVNSLKHADDKFVRVTVGELDGMVRLVVEDRGPGFEVTDEVKEKHHGMRLMRERAVRVGGRINIESRVGEGTRIEALLPAGVHAE
jgi:signal transduction histidine kinase